MEDDLNLLERNVSLSSLPHYTFVHGLTSYNFLIFRHNASLYIHPTRARSDIVKIHPEIAALIPITNFAKAMKKLPAALLSISLIGRTKKENKSDQLFVTLPSFRKYIVDTMRSRNANVMLYSAILSFLQNPLQPISNSQRSSNSLPVNFMASSSSLNPQSQHLPASSSDSEPQNIHALFSSSSPDFRLCRILLSKGLLLLILSRRDILLQPLMSEATTKCA
jgi:hypothetical protein